MALRHGHSLGVIILSENLKFQDGLSACAQCPVKGQHQAWCDRGEGLVFCGMWILSQQRECLQPPANNFTPPHLCSSIGQPPNTKPWPSHSSVKFSSLKLIFYNTAVSLEGCMLPYVSHTNAKAHTTYNIHYRRQSRQPIL